MLYYGYNAALCMELYDSRVENNKTQKNTSHRYSRIELKSCTNSDISIHWQCNMVQWKLTMAATATRTHTKKWHWHTRTKQNTTLNDDFNFFPFHSIHSIYLLAALTNLFAQTTRSNVFFFLFSFSPAMFGCAHSSTV